MYFYFYIQLQLSVIFQPEVETLSGLILWNIIESLNFFLEIQETDLFFKRKKIFVWTLLIRKTTQLMPFALTNLTYLAHLTYLRNLTSISHFTHLTCLMWMMWSGASVAYTAPMPEDLGSILTQTQMALLDLPSPFFQTTDLKMISLICNIVMSS